MKERERRLGSPASKRVGIRLLAVFSLVSGSACTLLMDPDRFDREPAADTNANADGSHAGPDSDLPDDGSGLDGGKDGSNTSTPNIVDCGAPVDTNTNAQNCGWCGHNCREQTCSNGMCEPEVLVDSISSAFRLAVDSQYLYYTSNKLNGTTPAGAVGRVQLDGGAKVQWTEMLPYGIVIDANYAYWAVHSSSTTGAIRKVPLGANFSQANAVDFVPTSSGSTCLANGIAQDSESVYWTAQDCKTIYKAAKNGGGVLTALRTGLAGQPTSIGVDKDRVYWASKSPGNDVETTLLDGGTYKLLDDSTGNIGLTVDNTNNYIYWAAAGGTLYRANKDMSGKTTLYSGGGDVNNIAVDGEDVYFAVQGPDALFVTRAGSAPKMLISGQYSPKLQKPEGLALDKNYVYVANQTGANIMRVAR